ncbi:hypothetical protein AM493_10710 [Flavobacterium akiainvivens]|uniref:FAD-binding FR-type domain-containing protein n=1 Tax=Flavobacterium akiainvivens TaxID=1202724 RepID=A0A0M8M9N4_9FLAO|nr:siderophore-interacting protein [Flavobacterium akiainvivens]KOS06453.1 hypothetical protein AM493_10710 [Flavobacterium akiainvivens]SFQ13182.1 NADPH-dependent ferric siderophore reductase, contains FAD-binding and SIP domains [Flavobacterium akiainvivens]
MPSAPKWLFDVVERLMPKLPQLQVSSTEMLSPSLKKIRLVGDVSLLDFREGYYMDFRVTDTDVRRYSPTFIDAQTGMLELLVHLHGNGPGNAFMGALKPGDTVDVAQPRGHKYYDDSVEKYVFFGDETSLAAAMSFYRSFKHNGQQFRFYFELDEENKGVPQLLGLENCVVLRKDGSCTDPKRIGSLSVFQDAGWHDAVFVLTGNVKSVQAFRKALKGVARGKVHTQGYWLEGKKGL